MGKLLSAATDPTQYDQSKTGWINEGKSLESPSRALFWHYLQPYFTDIHSKKILDVGSGTGWFLDLCQKLGAKTVIGVEPSQKNIEIASELYPETTTVLGTFEEFHSDTAFDLITAIMSLVHIKNIDEAFEKLSSLLAVGGVFIAIVYDFDYPRRPRFDYKIEVEDLNKDEYVVMVERKDFVIADIVRTSARFNKAAKKVGMRLVEDIPLYPTDAFIQARPQYEQFRNTPINRLLIFTR